MTTERVNCVELCNLRVVDHVLWTIIIRMLLAFCSCCKELRNGIQWPNQLALVGWWVTHSKNPCERCWVLHVLLVAARFQKYTLILGCRITQKICLTIVIMCPRLQAFIPHCENRDTSVCTFYFCTFYERYIDVGVSDNAEILHYLRDHMAVVPSFARVVLVPVWRHTAITMCFECALYSLCMPQTVVIPEEKKEGCLKLDFTKAAQFLVDAFLESEVVFACRYAGILRSRTR